MVCDEKMMKLLENFESLARSLLIKTMNETLKRKNIDLEIPEDLAVENILGISEQIIAISNDWA